MPAYPPTDSLFSTPMQTNSLSATGTEPAETAALEPYDPYADLSRILEVFKKCKEECMESRQGWERVWQKELHYINHQQWITETPRGWVNKKLQKWVPKPVTNKMAEVLSAVRTTFSAINLSPKVVPVGNDGKAVAAAEVADQMAPLIHEEHNMAQVMREADFWLIVNGTVALQTSWDLDQRANRKFIEHEQCLQCQTVSSPVDISENGDMCPICGGNQFIPAVNPDGTPVGEWKAFGRGKTVALSPFEFAFPQNFTRFDELPYIMRIRWRDKHWFEANRPDLMSKLTFEKQSSDRSLQIYKSLSTASEVSTAGPTAHFGLSGSLLSEGITEYELWLKPNVEFPEGLVCRVIGDKDPQILEVPDESLPGPFPYKDIDDTPLFPFALAQYEHIGGRLYGRSALSPLLQKQDQLNQLDSFILLIIQRMANPIWIIPEDAGIEHFSGEPGLMMKWRPMASSGNHKPERIAGADIQSGIWNLRQQIIDDIEDLSGARDIIKGEKPTGIEAFSALQLLVERSQSRFTSVFQSRGEMYRKWFSVALELERQFGPDERVMAVLGPNRGYSFEKFENAQLQGAVTIQIEDGSQKPQTSLGKRAAIEQAAQLFLLDPNDPDMKYTLLGQLGLADLVPGLNTHVQAALQMQDAFETWVNNPVGLLPLTVKPWHDPQIHWAERIKWLNTDRMRELMESNPAIEQIVTQHLEMLQMVMVPPEQAGQDPNQPGATAPGGGGMAMSNSNANSGSTKSLPKGNNQKSAQNAGPV